MEGGQGQDGICNGLNAGVQQMQSRSCGLERQGEKSGRMRPRQACPEKVKDLELYSKGEGSHFPS